MAMSGLVRLKHMTDSPFICFQPFDLGCEMLQILGPRDCFANCVCREGALWRVLSVLERADPDEPSEDKQTSDHQQVTQRKARGWAVLESLTSSPSIAGQLLSTSAWMELLGVLAGYTAFTKVWAARVGAAKTLSRLLWDPKTGSEASKCTCLVDFPMATYFASF